MTIFKAFSFVADIFCCYFYFHKLVLQIIIIQLNNPFSNNPFSTKFGCLFKKRNAHFCSIIRKQHKIFLKSTEFSVFGNLLKLFRTRTFLVIRGFLMFCRIFNLFYRIGNTAKTRTKFCPKLTNIMCFSLLFLTSDLKSS